VSADDTWPGRVQRAPTLWDPLYLAQRGLSRRLHARLLEEIGTRRGLKVLDVGCGGRPYHPWLAPLGVEYVGVDTSPGPGVDHVSPAEAMPFIENDSIDLVLCTQVLEHVDDPAATVREIGRVLRPEGACLLSTHGVFVYHPHPHDRWRWTHEGLAQLFHQNGFAQAEAEPTEGIASTLFCLVSYYATQMGRRIPLLFFLKYVVHPVLNVVAPRLDRYLNWTFADIPLPINYLVLARKQARP
jgi:SAM-dependent methyltransferase